MPRIYNYEIIPGSDSLLGPLSLANNVSSPTTLISFGAASSYKYIQIQYSLERNGIERTGRLQITNDGLIASIAEESVHTADPGITFSADIVSGSVVLRYTSTNTGFLGSFKYYVKAWS